MKQVEQASLAEIVGIRFSMSGFTDILWVADHHQLSIILDVLGTPSLDDFYAITSQRSREYIRALPFRRKKQFSTLFPNANPLVGHARTT